METTLMDRHYQAGDVLSLIIANVVYKLKRDSYICDFILLVYTTIMYNKYAKDLPFFICAELVMIFLVAVVQYTLLTRKGNFINSTAVDVTVSDDYITIKTSAFKGPLWYRKKPVSISMNKADTKLFQFTNPYPHIFKGINYVLKLENNGKEVFILADYFDLRLEEQLRNG